MKGRIKIALLIVFFGLLMLSVPAYAAFKYSVQTAEISISLAQDINGDLEDE